MKAIVGILFVLLSVGALRPRFKWGVSTSSYQVEGGWDADGRGPSIWDTFSQTPGNTNNNETGNTADDHYTHWKDDVKLIKRLGVGYYRFSISWSRVIPTGSIADGINEDGIKFYSDLVDELLEAGITPFVCLYHWDLPQGLDDQYGGWLSRDVVDDFTDFADLMFERLSDRVSHWVTFNEPWTFCWQGYGNGIHAPGTSSKKGTGDSWVDPYKCAHNLLLSHASASDLLQKKYHAKSMTMVLNSDFYYARDPTSDADVAAAQRAQEYSFGWFADPLFFGQYPDSMLDAAGENMTRFTDEESEMLKRSVFNKEGPTTIGVNYYTSQFAWDGPSESYKYGGWDTNMQAERSQMNGTKVIGVSADSSWLKVVPRGIRGLLKWVDARYGVAMIITENGVDCPDEAILNWPDQGLDDVFRIQYHQRHLENIRGAIDDGVDVRGYFIWSLMDNFEWADGYSRRFGLVQVDFDDPARPRKPKSSYRWYRHVVSQPPPHHKTEE